MGKEIKRMIVTDSIILLSLKMKIIFPFEDNMVDPGEYCAKWNRAITEGQILYNFT